MTCLPFVPGLPQHERAAGTLTAPAVMKRAAVFRRPVLLLFTGFFSLCGLFLAAGAAAQTLRDPTQPPAAFYAPAETGQPAAPARRLEAVVQGPGGREAVIGGERVRVGMMVAGQRVAAIRENEVLLQDGAGNRELLRLLPAVEKKIVPPGRAGGDSRANKGKSRGSL